MPPKAYDPAEPVLSEEEGPGPAPKAKAKAPRKKRAAPFRRRRRRRRTKSRFAPAPSVNGGPGTHVGPCRKRKAVEKGPRGRIQANLGIAPPGANRLLPTMRKEAGESSSSSAAPLAPLRLFEPANQLYDFEDSDGSAGT